MCMLIGVRSVRATSWEICGMHYSGFSVNLFLETKIAKRTEGYDAGYTNTATNGDKAFR
jgi:hypothetical protein